MQLRLEFAERLLTSSPLGLIGCANLRLQPSQDGRGYHKLPQASSKLLLQGLFTRIRLSALPAVSRAVVLDVAALLQLSHQGAPAVPTPDQPRVGEIVSTFTVLLLMSAIQNFLHPL